MWGGLPPLLASCPFSPKSIKIEIEEKKLRHFNPDIPHKKTVFYYQNCSDLLSEKIVLMNEKNF